MSKIGFEFPLDSSGQWDGFNDPGIEHFSGNPFEYLGREVTQNMIDAKVSSPARLVIRRVEVDAKKIPDVTQLKAVIGLCKAAADAEGPKAVEFFGKADKLISQPKVSVLQFCDSNTSGVVGPCENGTPFFALMKATGQSKKESGTASGSFGIGKFAPYTVSDLRTVFLSTAFKQAGGQVAHYVQGKSILMSHDDKGRRRRGTGFWGVKQGCLPVVDDVSGIPPWLKRPTKSGQFEIGTTLSVLGFKPIKNWDKILGASIAESFFGSICKGDLEVEIEENVVLDAGSLGSFFDDGTVREAIEEQDGQPERFIYSSHYLKALSSAESITESHQNLHLGHCRLHILVGEHLPKRVAVLRNGMLITDDLHGLRRFSDFKEFVAVVECVSDHGNALLRAMEPPAHDDFQFARLPADQRTAGRVGLNDLAKWVREMLRRHAQDPVADVTSIDELADFFGEEDAGAGGGKSTEENPTGKLNIRARPLKRKGLPSSAVAEGKQLGFGFEDSDGDGDFDVDSQSEGSGSGVGDGGEGKEGAGGSGGGKNDSSGGDGSDGGGSSSGTSGASGSGAQANKGVATLSLKNVRAVVTGPASRRIAFTAEKDGELRIELEDSGADTNRVLHVISTSDGVVEDGRVAKIVAAVGSRVIFDVVLKEEFRGTVRVKANAV